MPLITTSAQLRQYVTVGQNLSIESIRPQIFTAENKYLKSFIGSKLYTHLVENAAAGDYQELIALAESTAAKFAIWLYIIPGGLQIDDQGIYQAKTSDMWRLSKEEIDELKKYSLSDAMDALDMLLEYLEENAAAPGENLPEAGYTAYNWWYQAPARKRLMGLLIKKSEDFSKYVELYRSSLTFLMLNTAMSHVERHQIAPLLGDYYNTIRLLSNPTGEGLTLLELAQEALAKLSAAHAMRGGFHILENGRFTTCLQSQKIDTELLSAYKSEGENALERLRAKLEQLRPTGYEPLPTLEANSATLRRPGSRIILA